MDRGQALVDDIANRQEISKDSLKLILDEGFDPGYLKARARQVAHGRKEGILSGGNVIMPNISPMVTRKKYTLYDGKTGANDDGAKSLEDIVKSLTEIGYEADFAGETAK